VRKAFDTAGVEVFAGDWTDGDPAITRFLESRGRAGVPLYLWYEPGAAQPEELPQVLTPGMLTSRARSGALSLTTAPRPCGRQSRFPAPGFGQRLRIGLRGRGRQDEIGPFSGIEAADPVFGESRRMRRRG
jgi:hypothetical protein